MSEEYEHILIATSSTEPWSTGVYDPGNGAAIWSYKGTELQNQAATRADLVAGEALAFLVKDKPLLNFVGLQKRDQLHVRCVLPGVPKCATFTDCGAYACLGIDDKIYTYQLGNGQLVSIHQAHYQPIAQLQFSSDGFYLVSAGKDGMIQVWNLGDLTSPTTDSVTTPVQPLHKWQCHALGPTSLFVGGGPGVRAWVVSASLDRTVKIHSVFSGQLLLNIVTDSIPTAVSLDGAECRVFVGLASGNILLAHLNKQLPADRNVYVDSSVTSPAYDVLVGFKSRVTQLSVSLDGTRLVSGSEDGVVKLWDLESRRCVRQISVNGPVVVCKFIPTPSALAAADSSTSRSQLIVRPFDKQVARSMAPVPLYFEEDMNEGDDDVAIKNAVTGNQQQGDKLQENDLINTVATLQQRLDKALQKNKELYEFALQHVVGTTSNSS